MALSPQVVKVWADVIFSMFSGGLVTWERISAVIKAANPNVTDEELNAIIKEVREDAKRRKAISDAIVAGE
jgi:hypothetical protein